MSPVVESVDKLGSKAGETVSRHLELTLRGMLKGPTVVADPRYIQVVTGEAHPLGNLCFMSDPGDADGIEAGILPLVARPNPAAVFFASDPSLVVKAVLQKNGFESPGAMPVMAMDLELMGETSVPAGYQFARVGAGTLAEEWTDALAVGYEIPRPIARLFSPAETGINRAFDAPAQCFAILKDDRPVATAVMFLADGLAGLYCVATVPGERGKGLGAHITAQPLRLAQQLGYRVGVLQASPDGHPIYRRLGFNDVGAMPLYVRMPE